MSKTTKSTGSTKVQQLTAIPTAHANVQGKVLYYLQVLNEKGEELFINIGQGTFDRLRMLNGEEKSKE